PSSARAARSPPLRAWSARACSTPYSRHSFSTTHCNAASVLLARSWRSRLCSRAIHIQATRRSSGDWRAISAAAAPIPRFARRRVPWPRATPSAGLTHSYQSVTVQKGGATMPIRIVTTHLEFEGQIEEKRVVLEGEEPPVWGEEAELRLVGKPTPR